MIIVTGPGRSGTSFLAALYRELGFDPAGEWNAVTRSGFEAEEVTRINNKISLELGLPVRHESMWRLKRLQAAVARILPGRYGVAASDRLGSFESRLNREATWLRWESVQEVTERYGSELRRIAARYSVVKDPRFMWTLQVWAGAEVPIEHVLVSVRTLDEVIASHKRAGHMPEGVLPGHTRNVIVYAIGLGLSALWDRNIPHTVVRYPDYLEDPRNLYDAMRFPEPVSWERFEDVFKRICAPRHAEEAAE
jgi:hypothetical protein